jgi:LysR family transcriptional regulator, regulator of abg operon
MKFNPSQLEVFCVVVECGSIRGAARRLGVTQPSVTYGVRELESQLGAPLFQRQSRGVVLTTLGESLHRRALRLLEDWRQTQDELEQLRDGSRGSLRLAFSSGAAARVLAPVLDDFRRARPGVQLEIHELSISDPNEWWKAGQYDLAVISELDERVEVDWDRQVLFRVPLKVMARKEHPLAAARSLRDLQGCLWLLPGYGPRVIAEQMLALNAEPPRQVMLIQSLYIALSLVRRTDALALMSTVVLDDPEVAQTVVALPLQEPLPELCVSLVSRGMHTLTPAARQFADGLLQATKATFKGALQYESVFSDAR